MKKIDGFALYQQQMQKDGASRGSGAQKKGVGGPAELFGGKSVRDTGTVKRGDAGKLTGAKDTTQKTELSEQAKKLLEELKEKYSNMDFFVADYETDEEADRILARGTKEYSVLIEPETLEQMAANEATKQKYTDLIDSATDTFDDIKEQLGDSAQFVERISAVIDSDGSLKYFAHLAKMSDDQKERIDKQFEDSRERDEVVRTETRKAEKKSVEDEKERAELLKKIFERRGFGHADDKAVKLTTVSAGSKDELAKKIKSVDWDKVESVRLPNKGRKIDEKA